MASGKSKPRVKREPRDYQKQTFWLRSVEGEYLNERGELASFTPAPDAKAIWVSECRDCGGYFDQALPYHARFKPDRRCPTCSAVYRLNIAMGLPVKPFPLPKAPTPRKPPTAAQLRKRERKKAARKAKAIKKREKAKARKASHKLRVAQRRVARSPVEFAKRALRMVLDEAKRDQRLQLAAAWRAQNAPAAPRPKQTKAERKEATRARVAAHRAAKRTAAGMPEPRTYKKRRVGPLNDSDRREARRVYMRAYRAKKEPLPAADRAGAKGAAQGE